MPQFSPGEAKTAIAPIVAKPSGISCEVELFLGPDDATKVVSSGRVTFVSTGAAKNVSLPITMPGALGSYRGYIDVFTGELRFLAYKLTEDVVIAPPVIPPFSYGACFGAGYVNPDAVSWWYADLSFTVLNPNNVAVSHTLTLWQRSVSLAGYAPGDPTPRSDAVPPTVVTVQPGGSYIWTMAAHEAWLHAIMLSRPRSYFFWLQDELGNKSPEVNVVRG